MENRQALSVKEKMAYGCGDAASNMMWGMTSSYLMYYYTDIYGLPLVAVSWILLVPVLWMPSAIRPSAMLLTVSAG